MITTNYSRVKEESFVNDSLNENISASSLWNSFNSSGFDETTLSSPYFNNIKLLSSTGLRGKFVNNYFFYS